jgi:Transferrin
MPVGTLLANGIMSAAGNTDASVPNDIYAVKQFFGKSCASSNAQPPVDGKTGICTGCAGDCTWGKGEPYTDYPGSFACLKAGGGEVAFTRQGEVPAAEEADYKLVCPDGRTLPLSAFETCNLARVPSHMVVRMHRYTADAQQCIDVLIVLLAHVPLLLTCSLFTDAHCHTH